MKNILFTRDGLESEGEQWLGAEAWMQTGSRGLRNYLFLQGRISEQRLLATACIAARKSLLEEHDFMLDQIE
jgi:hypothetical protein